MEEQNSSIITLIDEDGNEAEFDLLMSFDYEGKRYAAMIPVDDAEGVADDEVVMLQVVGSGEDANFIGIENEVMLDEVFGVFMELWQAELDAEDARDAE